MNVKRWIVLPVAGVAALAIGIAAVEAAPSPAPSASSGTASTNYAQVFFQKLGSILGVKITPDNVKQAEQETLQQMCNDKKLTAAQCSALQSKLQNAPAYGPFGFGFRPGFRGNGLAAQVRTAVVDAVAKELNMSTTDLKSALRSGKTLAQLESSAGKSSNDVTNAAKAAAKTVLDKAVQAKTITQAQEDALLGQIGSGRFGLGFGGGFRHGGWNPGAGAPPAQSPAATPAAFSSTI